MGDPARARVGARAELLGYVLTMYDRRESITREAEALLRKTFAGDVLEHPIRVSTRHKASASYRKTIFQYDPAGSRGRQDYERLTAGVIERAHLRRSAERVAGVSAGVEPLHREAAAGLADASEPSAHAPDTRTGAMAGNASCPSCPN